MEENWARTEGIEEHLHNPLTHFSQRELGEGKQPWVVMIFSSGWSFLICRTCWRQPQTVLTQLDCCIQQTWFLSSSEHDTVGSGTGSPQPVSHLHVQQWVIRSSLPHFFLIYCPLGDSCRSFWSTLQARNLACKCEKTINLQLCRIFISLHGAFECYFSGRFN